MDKVLISACLVGDKVRYDAKGDYNPLIKELLEYVELVPFCAEVSGGLPTPRPKSEIKKDQVINEKGKLVTREFIEGAKKALSLCQYLGVKVAILKENSPSCGVKKIHDGSFKNRLIDGQGVLTKLLIKNGIRVISSEEIASYIEELKTK